MKTYEINLRLTAKEIELMRNCLSDLMEYGVSLNLKVANALLDGGYDKAEAKANGELN